MSRQDWTKDSRKNKEDKPKEQSEDVKKKKKGKKWLNLKGRVIEIKMKSID